MKIHAFAFFLLPTAFVITDAFCRPYLVTPAPPTPATAAPASLTPIPIPNPLTVLGQQLDDTLFTVHPPENGGTTPQIVFWVPYYAGGAELSQPRFYQTSSAAELKWVAKHYLNFDHHNWTVNSDTLKLAVGGGILHFSKMLSARVGNPKIFRIDDFPVLKCDARTNLTKEAPVAATTLATPKPPMQVPKPGRVSTLQAGIACGIAGGIKPGCQPASASFADNDHFTGKLSQFPEDNYLNAATYLTPGLDMAGHMFEDNVNRQKVVLIIGNGSLSDQNKIINEGVKILAIVIDGPNARSAAASLKQVVTQPPDKYFMVLTIDQLRFKVLDVFCDPPPTFGQQLAPASIIGVCPKIIDALVCNKDSSCIYDAKTSVSTWAFPNQFCRYKNCIGSQTEAACKLDRSLVGCQWDTIVSPLFCSEKKCTYASSTDCTKDPNCEWGTKGGESALCPVGTNLILNGDFESIPGDYVTYNAGANSRATPTTKLTNSVNTTVCKKCSSRYEIEPGCTCDTKCKWDISTQKCGGSCAMLKESTSCLKETRTCEWDKKDAGVCKQQCKFRFRTPETSVTKDCAWSTDKGECDTKCPGFLDSTSCGSCSGDAQCMWDANAQSCKNNCLAGNVGCPAVSIFIIDASALTANKFGPHQYGFVRLSEILHDWVEDAQVIGTDIRKPQETPRPANERLSLTTKTNAHTLLKGSFIDIGIFMDRFMILMCTALYFLLTGTPPKRRHKSNKMLPFLLVVTTSMANGSVET